MPIVRTAPRAWFFTTPISASVASTASGTVPTAYLSSTQWIVEYAASANAPGLPVADSTISTTKVTLPANLPVMRKADYERVKPEHPHWSLIVMTVLTQLSAGALLAQP